MEEIQSFTPLPNQDIDPSDSGSTVSTDYLDHYVIRVTPHDKFNFQQIQEFIHNEPQIFQYVIGRETVPREHFHIVASVDTSVSEQDLRDIIKAFLVPLWQTETGKLPKGFGNKQYNLQLSIDLDKAVSYAVKLDEYVFGGFEESYIQSRKAESFDKKKPSNFKSEYIELCNSFQDSDMDIREFMTKFCLLKAKYGQQVVMHHAYGYAVSNKILRDGDAEDFVENFLYKQ